MLVVENGTGRDAVVKIVEDITPQTTRRTVYVRSGDSWKIRSIVLGRYVHRFALGTDWDEAIGHFSTNPVYFEFADRLTFQGVKDSEGTASLGYRVTLHAVPEGTARTRSIAPELLEASDVE